MSKMTEEEENFFRFLRVAINSFIRGDSPIISAEFARRSIQTNVRPGFQEAEAHCRGIAPDDKAPETQAA
jgi:chemotaxis protein MotA